MPLAEIKLLISQGDDPMIKLVVEMASHYWEKAREAPDNHRYRFC